MSRSRREKQPVSRRPQSKNKVAMTQYWDPEQEFEIERIIMARVFLIEGSRQLIWRYHVTWKGYPGEDTWETKKSFATHGEPIITAFWRAVFSEYNVEPYLRVRGFSVKPPKWYRKGDTRYWENLEKVKNCCPYITAAEEPRLPTDPPLSFVFIIPPAPKKKVKRAPQAEIPCDEVPETPPNDVQTACSSNTAVKSILSVDPPPLTPKFASSPALNEDESLFTPKSMVGVALEVGESLFTPQSMANLEFPEEETSLFTPKSMVGVLGEESNVGVKLARLVLPPRNPTSFGTSHQTAQPMQIAPSTSANFSPFDLELTSKSSSTLGIHLQNSIPSSKNTYRELTPLFLPSDGSGTPERVRDNAAYEQKILDQMTADFIVSSPEIELIDPLF